MFETLTARLTQVFAQLRRRGKLSETDVDSALREVRLALLEADVHFGVAKALVERVRSRAVGAEVSKALNPAQQVIKIVNQELIETLGKPVPLGLSGPRPRVLMLVGLQGAGKTTAAAKLALNLRNAGERILLAACDPYRPAAAEQLRQLGERAGVEVFANLGSRPEGVAKAALRQAGAGGYGVLVLDTAGRSQLSEELMDDLEQLAAVASPGETLLVLDAMLGQEAVSIAQGFKDRIPITGLIMTKVDGDARGGAAISVRSVTGIPLKFLGTGEKLDALETYDPSRLASRILGMGDVMGLIERAEMAMDATSARAQAERVLEGRLDLEDWLTQMKQLRKIGSLGQIAGMLPGQFKQAMQQSEPEQMERTLRVSEAIISSMTTAERRKPEILNASRRRRIAAGSGTEVHDVNRLMKQFRETQRLLKEVRSAGPGALRKLLG